MYPLKYYAVNSLLFEKEATLLSIYTKPVTTLALLLLSDTRQTVEDSVDLPITRRHILDSSKLKEFADDNFNLDENGRKFAKWIENTVEKGEIARYEQFLLFPQCFQKTFTADT